MLHNSTTLFRIFVVDDHEMVRQGLASVLGQAGFVICGQTGNLKETLDHPQLMSAHLVVVDLSLGEDSGVALIKALRIRSLPVLVYSMHEESNVVRSAFAAGAMGYVTKREVASCLIEAVQSVLAGRQYVSPRAGLGLAQQPVGLRSETFRQAFSEQQQRLYELLGEGLSAEEIGERLHVSPRTVESYATRIMEKLGVSGMKELRRRAIGDRHRSAI